MHFYCQPRLGLIGWDATLQGGLLDRTSPYTIPANELSRLTFRLDAGVVMKVAFAVLEYSYTFRTREFDGGSAHRWGGVRVGMELKSRRFG